MKKLLRFSLVALFAVLSSAAMADDVTFDFNEMDLATSSTSSTDGDITAEEGQSFTESGVTVTISPKSPGNKNENRFWGTVNGPQLRCYSGTITITSTGDDITAINFVNGKWNDGNSVEVGELEGSKWSGKEKEVVLTIGGNTQINKIIVTLGSGSSSPTEGQTPETAITVERALEIIDALADGAMTDDKYYVTGTVADDPNVTSSGATFMLGGLKAFKLNGLEDKAIVNTGFIKKDDAAVVYGSLQKYKDKSGNITPEVTGGYVYSVNGKTQDDSANPEDAITTGKTADSPMTVDEALAYIENFSDNFITTNKYYISGTVSEVTEISTANGNATFNMGNLVVYRAKGLENKNITDENYLKANDEVIVYAKLQKYVKENTATPELSGGYIYSLNGKTTDDPIDDPYEFVGDGTETNPYTVEDVLHMEVPSNASASADQERVWVKGIIAGAINSNDHNAIETTTEINSNLALAAAAGETVFNNTVPVQLSTNALKDELGIANNPSHVGKELVVYGFIVKYFNVTGVKSVTDYILDGVHSGIQNMTIDTDASAPIYSLDGRRVDQNYRGVVIQNGVKRIQK